MLAIEVTLLAGRYVACEYNNRSRAEWPPHPARMFAAFVSAWSAPDEPSMEEADALRYLEALGAPLIQADRSPGFRSPHVHYVPDNDVRATNRDLSDGYRNLVDAIAARDGSDAGSKDRAAKDRALAKLEGKARSDSAKATADSADKSAAIAEEVLKVFPESRGRQGREFPTTLPAADQNGEALVTFVWPSATTDAAVHDALDRVAARVHRIGHSSSHVSCRVLDDDGTTNVHCDFEPTDGPVGRLLRVPGVGMLDQLVRDYAVHQASEPRTTASKGARYRHVHEEPEVAPRSILAGDLIILPFASRSDRAVVRPSIQRTLSLARALRGALMQHGPQPSPAILSGHLPGSAPTAPVQSPHVACIGLPLVGTRNSDGRLLGMGVLLPRDVSADDHEIVRSALRRWAGSTAPPTLFAAGFQHELDFENPPTAVTLSPSRWARASTEWASVTPIALDRFPSSKLSGPGRGLDEAAAIIADSIGLLGLPAPESIETTLQPVLRGSRHVRSFPGASIGGRPRLGVHARVRWSEPVAGPMLIGAARYLGYGLMLPLAPSELPDTP